MSPCAPLSIDWDQFLEQDWQRRPKLFRGALPDFVAPLAADELAGLALESEVESRIVERHSDAWHFQNGPFCEADFHRKHPWTLLVQRVDELVPEVADLLGLISPIPRWRIDDVMVSYASDGGSVGPHYDNYDVFLLQGEGRRRWMIGDYCDTDCALLQHPNLRLLAEFHTRQEFLLEPGDILYLPPRIAHWGIAEGECTTFSLGLRAPRINDMLSRWTDRLLEQLDSELFYQDTHLEPAARAGEIRPHDLQRGLCQIQAALDQMQDRRWFGELLTEVDDPYFPSPAEQSAARSLLQSKDVLITLIPGSRIAWQRETNDLLVFANGTAFHCGQQLLPALEQLCAGNSLDHAQTSALLALGGGADFVESLLEQGVIDVE